MKIHILGGGIGGMSAALHLGQLRESGALPKALEIVIHEKSEKLGGKALSQFPGANGGGVYPGEHGFRFFPAFYRCVIDTLKRIPLGEGHLSHRRMRSDRNGRALDTVYDLLTPAAQAGIGHEHEIVPLSRGRSLGELRRAVAHTLEAFPITPRDATVFATELTRFITTCHARALKTYEHQTLNDLVSRGDYSAAMVTFIRSLRALSAMRADRGSLRTLLFTATQMFVDFDDEYDLPDAVLPGPTDYMMLEPWLAEIERLGVTLKLGRGVVGLEFDTSTQLRTIRFEDGAQESLEDADNCVLALPFEVARPLLVRATNRPLGLAGVEAIQQREDNLGDGAEPMVGVQFWLREDVPMVKGHMIYPSAPWALTSISQAQFWSTSFEPSLAELFGVQELRGVLSAIVSAWDKEAPAPLAKAPQHCSREELAKEVLRQICDCTGLELPWENLLGYHVDEDILFGEERAHCTTPLWVSPKGSYEHRPRPDKAGPNLFVASDWARTETDVGSMESADEAARVATRAILAKLAPERRGVAPEVRPFRLWPAVVVAREADQWLFDSGRRHPMDLPFGERRKLLLKLMEEVKASGAGSTKATSDAGADPAIASVIRVLAALEASRWRVDDKDVDEEASLDAMLGALEKVAAQV